MSSEWTTTSPSHVALGPGGAVFEPWTARKPAKVAAGSSPSRREMPALAYLSKLKPAMANWPTKAAGPVDAAAVRWATMSRTVQPAHRDGVTHCWGASPARSSARAPRSVATRFHRSAIAVLLVPVGSAGGQRTPEGYGTVGRLSPVKPWPDRHQG